MPADNEDSLTGPVEPGTVAAPTADDPYLSTARIARMFDVTTETVRNWMTSEPPKLPGVQVNGRWKARQSDVHKLAQQKYGDA